MIYNITVNSIQIFSETHQFNNDLMTPMAAFLRLNEPDAFLLESVEHGQNLGRFSMIGVGSLIKVQGYDGYIVADWEIKNTSDVNISGWEVHTVITMINDGNGIDVATL